MWAAHLPSLSTMPVALTVFSPNPSSTVMLSSPAAVPETVLVLPCWRTMPSEINAFGLMSACTAEVKRETKTPAHTQCIFLSIVDYSPGGLHVFRQSKQRNVNRGRMQSADW